MVVGFILAFDCTCGVGCHCHSQIQPTCGFGQYSGHSGYTTAYLPNYVLSIVTVAGWAATGQYITLPDENGQTICDRPFHLLYFYFHVAPLLWALGTKHE